MEISLYDVLSKAQNSKILEDWYVQERTSTLWTENIPVPTFEEYLSQTSTFAINKVKAYVDEIIQKESTKEGQELMLTKCIVDIDNYIKKLSNNSYLNANHEIFVKDLISMKQLIIDSYSYLNIAVLSKPNVPHNQKIQWLGNLNLLTTLFFELMHGQEKKNGMKKFKTQPLIKAQKNQIMKLLMDNFVDSEAKPLSESTLSDYLNVAEKHSKHKLAPKYRIELPEN